MKQSIAFEYIEELLVAKRFEEANKIARNIYDADRSYSNSKYILALTDLYIGNFDEGEALLKNSNGLMSIDETLVEPYKAQGKTSRLISILEKNLSLDENDMSSVIILAPLYIENGRKYTAISLLQNLAKKKLELKSQIEEYIKTIQ
jgi:predicted Zn-dependent protease